MGASLYIDIIVIFLWKFAVRLFLLIKSRNWQRRKAIVLDIGASPAAKPGCPVVKISYNLFIIQEPWEGKSEIPFLFIWSAKQYAQMLAKNGVVIVRVDPKTPERSPFFKQDQHDYD